MEPINKETEAASLNKIHNLIENSTDYVQKMHCDTTKWTRPFKCAVPSCPNAFAKFDPDCKLPFKFHNFPVDDHFRRVWMEKCEMKSDADTYIVKVCSSHFKLDDYERNFKEEFKNPDYKRKLKADAVPTRNLCSEAILLNLNQIDDGCEEVQHENLIIAQTVEEVPPQFEEIKAVVDDNADLKEQIRKLYDQNSDVCYKMRVYDRKIKRRKRDLAVVKNLHKKLAKNNNNTLSEQRNLLSKVFSDAQINILLGKKKVIWSNDDLAMAFTLRQMSSRECYLYLKQTLNIPLPALSSVQKWAASK